MWTEEAGERELGGKDKAGTHHDHARLYFFHAFPFHVRTHRCDASWAIHQLWRELSTPIQSPVWKGLKPSLYDGVNPF